MKLRNLFVTLVCLLASAAGVQAQEKAAKSTETELEVKMDDLNAAYRKLGRQISDASKNADSLKQVATIKEAANAAMKLEPAKKKEVPAADQAKFVSAYQSKMKSFIGNIDKLEAALKAGKNAEAAELLKTLKQDQEEGHKEFRKDKKAKKK
jgi:soluble cytochrome b562